MPADFTDARQWTRDGTTQLIGEAAGLGESALGEPSALPGRDEVVILSGPLAEITAYLTGRPHTLTTAGGDPAPTLGPWL